MRTNRTLVLIAGIVLLTTTGCSQGINWQRFAYHADEIAADARGQLVFVYLRHWALPTCTRFEEEVLKDPAVLEQTKSMYCVVINITADRHLADSWGIAEPPGVVFMSSEGSVLHAVSGSKSAQELLDAIVTARQRHANPPARTNGPANRP